MTAQINDIDGAQLMTQHGITKVPGHIYHYKNWRYTNLNDAVAQAKRDAPLGQ